MEIFHADLVLSPDRLTEMKALLSNPDFVKQKLGKNHPFYQYIPSTAEALCDVDQPDWFSIMLLESEVEADPDKPHFAKQLLRPANPGKKDFSDLSPYDLCLTMAASNLSWLQKTLPEQYLAQGSLETTVSMLRRALESKAIERHPDGLVNSPLLQGFLTCLAYTLPTINQLVNQYHHERKSTWVKAIMAASAEEKEKFLMLAVQAPNKKLVKFYMDSVTTQNAIQALFCQPIADRSTTPFHTALTHGHVTVVKHILQEISRSSLKREFFMPLLRDEKSPLLALHIVIDSKNEEMFDLLVKNIPENYLSEILEATNSEGKNAQALAEAYDKDHQRNENILAKVEALFERINDRRPRP